MSKLFDKLAAEEDKFFSSQFMCPVRKGVPIRVRIAGIVVVLNVAEPKKFEGWGVFRPISYRTARFVRDPSMVEKQSYLELFPVLRLILCRRTDNLWYGYPAKQADTRFVIKGMVPVYLAEEVQLFEVVQTRFDGTTCWFDSIDSRYNPRSAVYLRESLTTLAEPDKLSLSGLTQEERDAYLMAYGPALEADLEAKRDKQEERIKLALAKAGAAYRSYIERGNTYTIEYQVDGEQHRSVVSKDTLQVQSAGICLSGGDSAFDLQSLVGVIREGVRRHRIVRMHGNQYIGGNDYDDYD
jgi:hypothetical protein